MGADDLEAVADSLDGDIVVAGSRDDLGTVARQTGADDQPRVVETGDAGEVGSVTRDGGVLVVAMDGSASKAESIARAADDTNGFVVAVFDGRENEDVDPSRLDAVRETVDATLLACRKRPTADSSEQDEGIDPLTRRAGPEVTVGGAFDFVRMIRQPGHINLDLADAQTVLTDGSLAVLCGGTAALETDGAGRAVRRAFEEIPPSVDAARGSGALVSVVGGPEMSIDDTIAAVRAVRGELGDVGDLIWGVATDEALAGRVTVDVVVDDITYRPLLSAGDPCPRCGVALATYAFGERTTLSCPDCGFADLSMSLRDRSGRDAGT